MASSAEQIRTFDGLALFSYGFRPFFLFGAAWSAIAVALLLPFLSGGIRLPTTVSPAEWHAHEMIYGYVPAVVAGFLLTAVPNWTGRLPVVGRPLMALFACWVAGRVAMLISAGIGAVIAALIDLSFLAALGLVIGREVLAARNYRNVKVLVAVALLLIGNAVFHIEALRGAAGGYGERIGIATTIMLIILIGGRIVPSFTRNWLAKRGPGQLPSPFGQVDSAVMLTSSLALAVWVARPDATATGCLGLAAMVANAWRLGRWAGHRTMGEPLVAVLHVAYAFVAVGFGLIGSAVLLPGVVMATGAAHGWTVGAIGCMTLAVMSRASLGHTGQPLTASWPVTTIYLAVIVAAVARITAAFDLLQVTMLHVAASAWILAFAGFVIVFAPLLTRRRA